MDYTILSNEINQPQYAGMSDAEIAAALNTLSQPTRRHVPARELIATAALNLAYAAIAAGAESTNAQVKGMCRSVLVILNLPNETVNLDDPMVAQMFGALQAAGVITAQQSAQIDALATVPGVSRVMMLGLGAVAEADIEAARDWQAAQEAEAARHAQYDALRERLINGPRAAMSRLQVMQYDGTPAPDWDEVLTWLL